MFTKGPIKVHAKKSKRLESFAVHPHGYTTALGLSPSFRVSSQLSARC